MSAIELGLTSLKRKKNERKMVKRGEREVRPRERGRGEERVEWRERE